MQIMPYPGTARDIGTDPHKGSAVYRLGYLPTGRREEIDSDSNPISPSCARATGPFISSEVKRQSICSGAFWLRGRCSRQAAYIP